MAGGQTVALRGEHRDQLAPSCHQRLKLPLFSVGQRPHKLLSIGMAVQHTRELGQGPGIDAVGLGEIPHGTGEIPGLTRIDDGQGQAGPLQGQSGTALIAPRRLQDDERHRMLFKVRAQRLKALCIVHEGLDSPAGTQGHFQGLFSDIDPHIERFRHVLHLPSLLIRYGFKQPCSEVTNLCSGSGRTGSAVRHTLPHGLQNPRCYQAARRCPNPPPLWICGQCACGAPGRLPWKTLRVSHRAPLCPQAPQRIKLFFN